MRERSISSSCLRRFVPSETLGRRRTRTGQVCQRSPGDHCKDEGRELGTLHLPPTAGGDMCLFFEGELEGASHCS